MVTDWTKKEFPIGYPWSANSPKVIANHELVNKLSMNSCRLFIHSLTHSLTHSFVSSVRSSYSHPNLLLTHPTPLFQITPVLNFHFLSHYSYIKALMLYKGNHWTRCAGFMDASWVRLGITNDDLGIS